MKKSMLKDVGGEPMNGVRRLLAALMVGLMMVSGAKLPVMATEGQEAHEYIPPENPRWDETKPGVGYIDIVDSTKGYVVAALYKDGKQISTSRGSSDGTSTRSYTFNTNMNYSGIYTFKVKMSADNSDGSRDMSYGAVSVESAPFVYNRPSEELATPGNLRWSSEQQNVGEWDPVEHAQSYMAILSRDDQFVIGLYSPASITKANFSQYMADTEGHTYTFRVIAYSEDINKWANSNNSLASEPYGGTSQAQAIQDNIASAANADENTVNDVVNQLKSQDNASAMCNAIQDSEATQQNLSKLENTYNQKNGITVSTNSEVESIPTEGISVIGAGLNAEAGSTVNLNVSPTPTDPKYDTDIYKNVIAFDMKLVDVKGDTKTELTNLEIPAVITLPIPAGMNTTDMFILHFKSDGSYEKITPAIIENGTKAKFTITSFSTFAFANANNSSTDQVTAFVSRMYTVALSRSYDESGLKDWTSQLKNGTNDGAGIAQGFIESTEFVNRNLSNEQYLDVLYHTFFDRDPDEGGYQSWLAQLNNGTSRRFVLAGFVNSEEFTNLCNNYGITRGTLDAGSQQTNAQVRAFVERMYVKALGRQGEEDGINSWTQRIVSGEWQAAEVAKAGFFNSQEYVLKNRTNDEFVEDLYQALFDRPSDEAGKADWLSKLANGASREDVMNGFGGSQEFANMLAGFGL
ncbi:protein of unknown function [Butyrivibrio proteoclasticus]|uniref:DUF4214 domain-containing protein n=1 Tax=Butyrivibrio proteoclasticus TaxID=43305 RepID=A0A1I5TYW1_9FIRM|nr:DUF4214 domain-containing protein [Butyrivibrio proteoclasticus]SFP88233.1 protein of unknown function [Butyrivibrio proteoclasticus]